MNMDFLVWLSNPKRGRKWVKSSIFLDRKRNGLFLLYNSGLKTPFLKFRSVFKQQSLFPNKKSKYFVLAMLKQNVSVSPNHFFLTCQNETFVHFLIFFAYTVGSCIFQWTYPFEECHSTLKITIHIELPLLPHYVSCKRAKCEFLTRELVRLQSWPVKPEKAQCQLKGSKCPSAFLQPSPGSHSAGQCYEPQSGGLSCCLWRAHIWGSNQSSHPRTCVQISAVILIKAACLNQGFWEMHFTDHRKAPVDLQVPKKPLCWPLAGRLCGI